MCFSLLKHLRRTLHIPLVNRQTDRENTAKMSLASLKNVIATYAPRLSDSDSDLEKEHQTPLHRGSDIESSAGFDGHEKSEKKDSSSRFIDGRTVSDAIIGLSDGMTVPFALTAGLSALGDTKVVVFGGLAELIAGAISMGLGGYLGAKSEELVFPFKNFCLIQNLTLFLSQRIILRNIKRNPTSNRVQPRFYH